MGDLKMKMKNSLALVAGSLIAVTSASVFAQGQGSVEGEVFVKRYFTDSDRGMGNGQLYGGGLGYFLTDDVELALSYGEYHDLRGEQQVNAAVGKTGRKDIKGSLTSLDAYYHFGQPGDWVRPYISTGVAHQSISNSTVKHYNGRDRDTILNLGVGAKLYFTDNFYARAGVDGMYGLGNHHGEYMLAGALGFNFGGSKKVEPVEEVVVVEPVKPAIETLRVQLDVKFAFDKATINEGSYADIKQVADFMKQFPQTTTVVEGYTDSQGPEAYNQKLSQERADAVRNALVDYGVEGNRVEAVGYGEANPIADNATKEGRAMNRRVDATVEAQVEVPQEEVTVEQAQPAAK